jgi:hypothetical protein
MQISIVPLQGAPFTLDVKPLDTILTVKQKIQDALNMPSLSSALFSPARTSTTTAPSPTTTHHAGVHAPPHQ